MKILWLTWKDMANPLSGGAEVVASEIGRRLAAEGHELLFITGGFKGGPSQTRTDGYHIIRLGNRFSVYWQAYRYVKRNLADWPDLVIEEVNTIPFFSNLYLGKPRVVFFHMLCRKIWFYQMVFPLSLVGFLLEPLYIKVLRGARTLTVSDSTRQDLMRYGFSAHDIDIISEGLQIKPIKSLDAVSKYDQPTILSLGAIRSMKRTLHQVKAFEIAKRQIPDLQLKIAGQTNGRYGQKVLDYIRHSRFSDDIEYLGRVSNKQRQKLMQSAHLITVTSVKEGWGLIVTEAASQGTPAVVYDVDGLRDSVRHERTGLVTVPTPEALAESTVKLLRDQSRYESFRKNGWQWSKDITFDKAYRNFKEAALS